jgi:Flagellar hook-length control protein FliK
MLPRIDVPGIAAVGRVDPALPALPVADARQEAFQRALQTLVGTSMQAEVLSKFQDGSFLVKVAGTSARMMLPLGVQVGSEVPLTLVAAGPRPTFQLATGNGEPAHAAQTYSASAAALPGPAPTTSSAGAPLPGPATAALSAAATLLGKAPMMPASLLPELDPATPTASLSAAARIITSVLNTAHSAPGGHATLVGGAPLIAASIPAPAPQQLAHKLEQTIAQSGLFYESHVAEWAGGTRGMPELMREPQMQKTPGAPATDPGTAQFINLQLTSHEQSRVAWQGQLGAGQPMQWEIHKEAPEQHGRGEGDSPAQPAWRSGMRLRFALLGEIAATVVMSGDQLHIELQAGSNDVGSLLRAHAERLSAAMDAAGTPLSSLNIAARPAGTDG